MTAKDHQDLLDLIVSIARAGSDPLTRWKTEHISKEFLCADSSPGSKETHSLFPPHSPREPAPGATTSGNGAASTVKPSADRDWWRHQDDANWIREFEGDDTDPQSWK